MKMAGIGVNLRVTGHCSQGGRKYMEDMFSVAYQQTVDLKDLEYAFFGIFDGHGGHQAAMFAKENLLDFVVNQRNFWSDKDEDVLRAIREGFIATHYAMWKDLEKWPKTATGLPSTSGTTATIAFIMNGKIYFGHVGDTAIVLGYQEEGDPKWKAKILTKDHKPEYKEEVARINRAGGKVVSKSGVPRVVWNRPRLGHQGPVRRSTPIDEIPFLAVARSLGDFWSYNAQLDQFVVSPEPDVGVHVIDVTKNRCLIFGTDGVWNMLAAEKAINIVQRTEIHNEKQVIFNASHAPAHKQKWVNPSKNLVERALEMWVQTKQRADNTSVVTLMLDPPGPPRAQVILNQNLLQAQAGQTIDDISSLYIPTPNSGGVAIFTRFPGGVQTLHSPYKPIANVKPTHTNCTEGQMEEVIPTFMSLKSWGTIFKTELSAIKTELPTIGTDWPTVKTELPTVKTEFPTVKTEFPTIKTEIPDVENRSSNSDLRINQSLDPNHSALKRRTRSEDKPSCEEGSSDAENERLGWPTVCWGGDGKKRKINKEKNSKTPTWKYASFSGVEEVQEMCKTALEETTRTLRSDTQAAIPIKTLRSRNIDLRRSNKINDSFYDSLRAVDGTIRNVRGKRSPATQSRTSGQGSTIKRFPQGISKPMPTRSHGLLMMSLGLISFSI